MSLHGGLADVSTRVKKKTYPASAKPPCMKHALGCSLSAGPLSHWLASEGTGAEKGVMALADAKKGRDGCDALASMACRKGRPIRIRWQVWKR